MHFQPLALASALLFSVGASALPAPQPAPVLNYFIMFSGPNGAASAFYVPQSSTPYPQSTTHVVNSIEVGSPYPSRTSRCTFYDASKKVILGPFEFTARATKSVPVPAAVGFVQCNTV